MDDFKLCSCNGENKNCPKCDGRGYLHPEGETKIFNPPPPSFSNKENKAIQSPIKRKATQEPAKPVEIRTYHLYYGYDVCPCPLCSKVVDNISTQIKVKHICDYCHKEVGNIQQHIAEEHTCPHCKKKKKNIKAHIKAVHGDI